MKRYSGSLGRRAEAKNQAGGGLRLSEQVFICLR
jgi:hypothetical protein